MLHNAEVLLRASQVKALAPASAILRSLDCSNATLDIRSLWLARQTFNKRAQFLEHLQLFRLKDVVRGVRNSNDMGLMYRTPKGVDLRHNSRKTFRIRLRTRERIVRDGRRNRAWSRVDGKYRSFDTGVFLRAVE